MRKIGLKKLCVIVFIFAAVTVTCRWDITVSSYEIHTDKISSEVKIMLLTDLHSSGYGKEQKNLIEKIDEQAPDIILLGGDIADDKVPHDRTWQLLSVIGKRYPCYYVSGNHEYWSGEIDLIKERIASYSVTVMEGENLVIDVDGQSIQLCGIDDPEEYGQFAVSEEWVQQLKECSAQADKELYSVLLSHRPEAADYYKSTGFDLILSGHAHGGQVRIPCILNGLYAPNQGVFPQYAGGYYDLGSNEMIVSRGLCKNMLPRVFNRPEIVVVSLSGE